MNAMQAVDPGDPRVGVEWLTLLQLAEMNGKTVKGVRRRLLKKGIAAVGRIVTSGALLYAASAAEAVGLLPETPFTRDVEVWASEYAAAIGASSPTALIWKLRARQGDRLELGRPAEKQELIDAGIARKLGGRWALNRAAADELLAPPYDPEREADAATLHAELGELCSLTAFKRALRRHVPAREVIDGDGSRRLVFEREAAAECFAGRFRQPPERARPPALPEATMKVWRTQVGPILLAAPTRRIVLSQEDASWLLGLATRELRSATARDRDATVPDQAGIAVAWLEGLLHDRGDFEGLALLAGLLDGRLVVMPRLDRASALLQVTEKAV
jgi:hypothetical protein